MAKATNKAASAHGFDTVAAELEADIITNLWDSNRGRFFPQLSTPEGEIPTPAIHANVLALFFKIGSDTLRGSIIDYLEPFLLKNFEKGISDGNFGGHLELYFMSYLFPALAEHNRPDLAELMISKHYGYLESLGDDTLPECFCRAKEGVGSRCHSWSGAPAIYAARYVLVLRHETLGNPNVFIFNPKVSTISSAKGALLHPDGKIEIEWFIDNHGRKVKWNCSSSVEIKPVEN